MNPTLFLRGLRRLADFSGRDTREQFWGYAGPVLALVILAWALVFLPDFSETMAKAQQFAAAHPDQAQITTGPGSYSISIKGSHPELGPDFAKLMAGMALVFGVAAALLAAAVARRLHDRGLTGLLGLLPIPFFAFAAIEMPKAMAAGDDYSEFLVGFSGNMAYVVSLAGLGFLLSLRSAEGANRYGEQPPPVVRPPPPPLTLRRP